MKAIFSFLLFRVRITLLYLVIGVLYNSHVSAQNKIFVSGCDSTLLQSTQMGIDYLWDNGATTPGRIVLTAGMYWVDITLQGGGIVRDSFDVSILPTPSVFIQDTSVCGPKEMELSTQTDGQAIWWYLNGDAKAPFLIDLMLELNVEADTTIYLEAINGTYAYGGKPSPFLESSSSLNYIAVNGKGLQFDVQEKSELLSVDVFIDSNTSFDVELLDSSGSIVSSKSFNISSIDSTRPVTLPLEFELIPGINYQLVAKNIQGGLARQFPTSGYPYSLGSLMKINGAENGFSQAYFYFYNWLVTGENFCKSDRDSISISVLPTVPVDLGPDTLLCGVSSFLLSVPSIQGATYTWSTNETTPSIQVGTTDQYWVNAQLGTCESIDTVTVEFSSIPSLIVSDTSVCGPGEVELIAQTNGESIWWYSTGVAIAPFLIDSVLELNVTADTAVYLGAVNGTFAYGGKPSPFLESSSSLNYISVNGKGLQFDVQEKSELLSVDVFISSNSSFDVELLDGSGSVVSSKSFSVSSMDSTAAVTLPLEFELLPGTNYQLVAKDIQGGLARQFPTSGYPYSLGSLVNIKGAENGFNQAYFYFYNWLVTGTNSCNSDRDSISISVVPTVPVDLGPDTLLCGESSFLLSVPSIQGATYTWSTNETTPSIQVGTTDQYWINAQLGTCVSTDTVTVEFSSIPSLIVSDTSVCGPGEVELSAQTTGESIWWYLDPQRKVLASFQNPYNPLIDSAQKLYLISSNSSISQGGKADPFIEPVSSQRFISVSEKGLLFDALEDFNLVSVDVYIQEQTNFTIKVINEAGVQTHSKEITISPLINSTQRKVELDFDIPKGNNYQIVATNIQGGLMRLFPTSGFPHPIGTLARIKGAENGLNTAYFYFYNWAAQKRNTCTSNIDSLEVDVKIVLGLEDSIYSCEPFQLSAQDQTFSYQWSQGSTGASIFVDTSGVYIITANDNQGCIVSDSSFVEIPEDAGLQDLQGLMTGGTLCGDLLLTNYDSTAIFRWSTGDSSSTLDLTLLGPGTYWVEVQEPRGCFLTDTITVSGFSDFPILDLGEDQTACDSLVIDAGSGQSSYEWSNGDTAQMITAFSSGLYIATVGNQFGCQTSDTVGVSIDQSPQAEFSFNANLGTVQFFLNQAIFATYLWDFGDGSTGVGFSPSHTYQAEGVYTVTLIAVNNCGRDTSTQTLEVFLTSLNDQNNGPSFILAPNPVDDRIVLSWENLTNSITKASLRDLRGATLMEWPLSIANPSGRQELSFPAIESGIYLLTLEGERVTTHLKLIKR